MSCSQLISAFSQDQYYCSLLQSFSQDQYCCSLLLSIQTLPVGGPGDPDIL